MAARATGTGTISFGLVSIPVKLFSTVDTSKDVHFNYLAKDGSRLKQQYVRASDGAVVPNDERVLGYEFAKGQYVTFSKEELKALEVKATEAIEIAEFVPLAQVERIYIEKVYYLGPDKGASRSYHLLRAAMQQTGRAAVARYLARGKSYLVLLRPMQDGIVMEQLKHADELRPLAEVPLEPTAVNAPELGLAIQIVDQISRDEFDPTRYEDEIRAKKLELIEQKVQGREISVPPEEKPEARIIDLMEALRASVAGAGRAVPGDVDRKPARKSQGKAPKREPVETRRGTG
jgi:DNA end-binding protein Ku